MNTCMHSASHGTVNSVHTTRLPLPLLYLVHPQPLCALPPSLPRASQLAARALDGQVELVVRAVGAVRVGVPLSPPAPCSRRAGPSPSGGAPWRGRVRGGCQIQMYARIHCIQPCMQPRLTYTYHTSAYVCHIRMHHLGLGDTVARSIMLLE